MNVDRRKKVFLLTLVLTVGIMVVDRAFVMPRNAGARNTGEEVKAAADELVVAVPDLPETVVPSVSLARRLESVCPDDQKAEDPGRDAFALPGPWRGMEGSRVWNDGPSDPVESFLERHRLTAVAVDGQTVRALIDDHVMVRGQELDGFTLVSIEEDRVVFAQGPKRLTLNLSSDP